MPALRSRIRVWVVFALVALAGGCDGTAPGSDAGSDAASPPPPLEGLPDLPLDSEAKIAATLEAARLAVTGGGPARLPSVAFGVVTGGDSPAVHIVLADDAALLAGTVWAREDRVDSYSRWQLRSPDLELFRFWIPDELIEPGTTSVPLSDPFAGILEGFGALVSAPPVGTAGVVTSSQSGELAVSFYEAPTPGTWGRLSGTFSDVVLLTTDSPPLGLPETGVIGRGEIEGMIDVPLVVFEDLQLPPRVMQEGLSLRTEVFIDTADSDVWGAGDLAFIGGNSRAPGAATFHVVDLAAGTPPVPVFGVGTGKDIKYENGHVFVGVEPSFDSAGGVRIYDVRDPAIPSELPFLTNDRLADGVHNLYVANGLAYCVLRELGVEIYDVSDPAAPFFVGEWGVADGFVGDAHDVAEVDGRLYVSALQGGLYILDIGDPAAPVELSHVPYEAAFTHNAWPSADGAHVFTTDEYIGGGVRVFDISDLDNPEQVTQLEPPRRNSVVHNVFVTGGRAYLSYYSDGVEVWDVADPAAPRRLAFYRTVGDEVLPFSLDLESQNANATWGVWPFGGDERIYASDSFRGLLVLELTP